MIRKSRVLNGILVLILLLLLGWGGLSWLQPRFPDTVDGDDIIPAHRELKVPTLTRQTYSKSLPGNVARLNLFRKQRKPYYRPKPPKRKIKRALPKVAVAPTPPPPPPKLTAPPPQLVLTGVMLLADKKVAIFSGTYSEIRGGKLVQNLKPRRRGYKVGEILGGYRIKAIDRSHATLSALSGNQLTLTLSKTPPTQKIQKAGNRLTQKGKQVVNNTPGRLPTPRTRRSQPVPSNNNRLNRVPPRTRIPQTYTPPAPTVPGAKSPAPVPSNPNRPQGLRQKSMGF